MSNKSLIIFLAFTFYSCDLSTSKTIPSSSSNFKIEEWKLALAENSFLFQSNDQMIVVSANLKFVNLSYVGNNDFSCAISAASKNVNHLTNGQALGNGKLVLFGKHSKNIVSGTTHEFQLTIVIVNPEDCTVEVTTKNYIAEKDSQKAEAQLVPYYESFDVFIPNSDTCSPCRYGDRGQQVVNLSYKLESKTEGNNYTNFFVKSNKEFDSSKGYFYTLTYPNGTSVMRMLNSDYKLQREQFVDKEIISAFVSIEGNIDVCFVHRVASQVFSTCQRLSTDLRVIRSLGEHISHEKNFVRVFTRPFSEDLSWMALSIFQEKNAGNNLQKTCLQALNSAKNVICSTIETPRFNLNVFVFPDKGCFSTVNYYTAKPDVEIKCFLSTS